MKQRHTAKSSPARQARRATRLTAAVAAALLASQSARAATLYWDSNGATPGAGITPTGTWGGSNAFWTTDPTGSSATTTFTAGSDVVFSAGNDSSGAATVTVSGTQAANSVTITQGDSTTPASYTLTGGALSLGAGGLTIQSGSGSTTIASAVTIAGAQSWANDSSNILTVTGAITYSNQLTLTSGTISLASSTSSGTGGIKLDGATLIVGNSNSFSASNTVTLNSGTIENINSTTRTVASTVNITGDVTFAAIAGNAGVLTFSGAKTVSGNRTLTFNDVTMNFTTKALTLNGDLVIQGTGGVTNSGGLSTGGVDRQITFNQAGAATFSGALADAASTITVAGGSNATFGALTGGTAHAFKITGSGIYTFNGASTFTGGATINDGVALLAVAGVAGTSGGLGTGAVTVNSGGELRVQATNGLIGNSSITLAGGTLGAFQSSSITYGGNILVTADSTVANERPSASTTSVTNTFGTLSIGGNVLNVVSTNNQTGGTSGVAFSGTTVTGNATFNVTNNSNGTNTTVLTLGALSDDGTVHNIAKSGNGTLTLATAANLTAGTGFTVTGGLLNETASNGLGSGPAVLNMNSAGGTATFTLANAMTQTLAAINFGGASGAVNAITTGSGTITLNGDVTLDATNNPGTSTFSGRLALSDGSHTFNIGSSGNSGVADLTVSAVISDAGTGGSIVKTGTGVLLLSAANTFTGGLTIKNGTVVAGISSVSTVSGAAGPSTSAITLGDSSGSNSASLLVNSFAVSNPINVISGTTGTLTIGNNGGATTAAFTGGITLSHDLTVLSTGTGSVSLQVAPITGTGNLVINDAGTTSTTVISTGGGLNFTGTITNIGVSTGFVGSPNGGTTQITAVIGSNVTSVTQASTSSVLQLSSATGNSFGNLFITAGTVIGSGGASTVLGLGTVTIGDSGNTANASLLLGSSVTTTANPIVVAAGDPSAVYALGNSPITASTAKHSGSIALQHDLVIASASQGAITASGSISGTGNITINNVSSSALDVTLSGSSINNAGTITNVGTNATNGGMISGALGANVTSVIENGPSKLTLSGTNTSFSGTVLVNAGTLLVTGANSLKAANTVSVGGAGTFDVGNAVTIGGLNNISGSGGTVTASTASRVLTLSGSGNYLFGGAITSDNLGLTVALTSGGSQTLSGNNTYTGATVVNLGTLALSNDGSNGTMGGTVITVGSGVTPTASAGNATLNIRGNYSIGTATAGSLTINGGNTGATPLGQGTLSLQDSGINTLTLANATVGNTNLTLGGTAGNAAIISLDLGNSVTDSISVGQTVVLNDGGAIINLSQLSGTSLTAGSYSLLTYGTLTGNGVFTLGATPATPAGQFGKFSLNTTGTAVQLVFSGFVNTSATAYWTGGLDTVWNSFTGGMSNFSSAASGGSVVAPPGNNTDVFFTANSAANFTSTTLGQDFIINSLTFTGAGTSATSPVSIGGVNALTLLASGGQGITVLSGSGNHTISAPVVLGSSQTWTVADAANIFTVSGGVGGNFNLTKAGDGTLVLSGVNHYVDTTISDGTLQVSTGGSLGTGIVTDNASLIFDRTDASLVVANNIGGSGTVTKANTGTVALSGANSYSGVTNVAGGTLAVRSNSALGQASAVTGQGVVVSAGAQVELQAGVSIVGEALTITATPSGASITVGLDNSGNNEWAGPILLQSNGANNARIGSTTGTLTISGDISSNLPSSQNLVLTGVGNGIISGSIGGAQGLISTASGTGTWTLSGANTFTGATAFQGGGTFVVNSFNSVTSNVATGAVHTIASSLGAPTTVSAGTINFGNNTGATAGTVRYVGAGETTDRQMTLSGGAGTATLDQSGSGLLKFVGAVTNSHTVGAKTLQLSGSTAGIGEIAGTIADGIGTTAVSKTGTGTWILSGLDNYSGTTSIKAGTLVVSGAIAGSTTTVGDAANLGIAAVLGGGGTTGDVNVGAAAGNAGATLSPHAGSSSSSLGTTLTTGALTFFDNSTHLALELGRTQAFASGGGTGTTGGDISDHVQTSGMVTLDGADLDLSLLNTGYAIAEHDVFFLIINGSGSAVNGTFGGINGAAAPMTEGSLFTVDGQVFSITYQANFSGNSTIGGNDVALIVVPEPNAVVSILAGFGMLLGLQRRRFRR